MENKKPLISFILPNYNNQHVIDLFFEKFLENNTYDNYEFIVCDDGSEDDGLQFLYKWQKSGKIKNMQIIAEPHKGIINALNKCLYASKGEFIIRCDGDATIETKSFIEKFLNFYYINPEKIGVITSKVITDGGIVHAIGRNIISPDGLHDRGKIIREKRGQRIWDCYSDPDPMLCKYINTPAEIDSALGVFTFCDRETALKVGGFDKNYPLWLEDDDFYLSFRLHGKKCFYLPEIEVCHRFSLRGNRNPALWSKNKKTFLRLYSKIHKDNIIIYSFFGIPILKIKQLDNYKKYYIFNIQFYSKKHQNWRTEILKHDYKYMSEKWGFDILNPDMKQIKEKYKGTEILWNYNSSMKEEGEKILEKYEKENKLKVQKICVLTAYHKPYWIPNTSIYMPIFLGKALGLEKSKDGCISQNDYDFMSRLMIGDDTGKNISNLNRCFNETTAIYWAMHNLEKLDYPEYIGLAHYRRHFIFNFNDEIKTKDNWLTNSPFYAFDNKDYNYIKAVDIGSNVLKEDVAVPYLYDLKNINPDYTSPKDNYTALGNKSVYYETMKQIIESDFPEYFEAFKKFDRGTCIYLCNMFIMKRDLFLQYCNFLFSILFKINSRINSKNMPVKQKRSPAFLSEFLLTIFLFKQIADNKITVKEMFVSYLRDGIFPPIGNAKKKNTLIQNIFSVKNTFGAYGNPYKVVTVLGIKFKFQRK